MVNKVVLLSKFPSSVYKYSVIGAHATVHQTDVLGNGLHLVNTPFIIQDGFLWAHPEIGASGRGLRATKAPPRESCPTGSPPGPVAAGPPLLASGSDSATLNLEPEPRTH